MRSVRGNHGMNSNTTHHGMNNTMQHGMNNTMQHRMNNTMQHGMNNTMHHGMNNTMQHGMNNTMHHGMNNTMHHVMNNTMHHVMNSTMNHSTHSNGNMDHNGNMMNHNSDSSHNAGHALYFYVSEQAHLFFKPWDTDNKDKFSGACVGLAVLAFLYEGLKIWRQYLVLGNRKGTSTIVVAHPGVNGLKMQEPPQYLPARSIKRRICIHLLQTLLHLIQVFLGYMLMLAFMTYNTWICVAVLVGTTLGYFVFGWMTPVTSGTGEHCN